MMDRHELIIGFIRNNLNILINEEDLLSLYKKKKHNYFMVEKAKSKQGMPRDSEIANELVWYLIKTNVVTTKGDLAKYLQFPFLKSNVIDTSTYYDAIKLKTQSTPNIDFSKLKKADYLEALKDQIREELKYEEKFSNFQDIDAEIKSKIEEYNSLPSVVDSEDFPEPEPEKPVNDLGDVDEVWWKQLNLTGNPFPKTEGLLAVKPEYFDNIVTKTKLFRRYLSYIKNTPEEVFKNTIFFGEFGSGKTSLFEFLGRGFSSIEIETVYVQLYSETDFQSLVISFKEKIMDELSERLGFGPGEVGSNSNGNLDQTLRFLINSFFEKFKPKGLVIFVDDLHKSLGGTPMALEFLSWIQIFTSEILRKTHLHNLSFYVAGARDWKTIVSTQPRYSGSLARRETLEDVTEEDAWDMLNKRLEAFYPNPEVKRVVDRSFVSQVYRDLQTNKLALTFRSFIQRIEGEFDLGNFRALTSDPVHIPKETIAKIKASIESVSLLRKRFDILLNENMVNDENRIKSLRLLLTIYQKRKVREEDYLEDIFYLQALNKAGLIQKYREDRNNFSWVVNRLLIERSKVIAKEFSLSLDDYLLKVYSLSERKKERESEEIGIISKLKDATNKLGKEILTKVVKLHKEISTIIDTFNYEYSPEKLAKNCVESLEILTSFYLSFVEHFESDEARSVKLSFWVDYWYAPEEISRMLDMINDQNEVSNRIWHFSSLYRGAFIKLIQFIQKEYFSLSAIDLGVSSLENNVAEELVKSRDFWKAGSYEQSIIALYEIVQLSFRNFVQNSFTLLYGDMPSRLKQVGEELREKINDRMSIRHAPGAVPLNEFLFLSLDEIGELIVGKSDDETSPIWDHFFSKIFDKYDKSQFRSYFILLKNLRNTVTEDYHLHSENYLDLRSVISASADIIKNLDKAYLDIIHKGVCTETLDGDTNLYVSLDGLRDKYTLKYVHFDVSKIKLLVQKLLMNNVRLGDQAMIENYFSLPYREFFCYLGLLVSEKKNSLNITDRFETINVKGSRIKVRKIFKFGGKRTPKILISHSSVDQEFAMNLAKDLNGMGIETWMYEMDVKVGDSIFKEINDAYDQCNFFGLVLSKDSVDSEWVTRELSTAFIKELDNKSIRILPIYWKQCKIPNLIMEKRYADFRKDYDYGMQQLLSSLAT